MSLPAGVVVSIDCWSRYRSTLQASSVWIVPSRSIRLRPTRSILQAMMTSNLRLDASLSIWSRPGRWRDAAGVRVAEGIRSFNISAARHTLADGDEDVTLKVHVFSRVSYGGEHLRTLSGARGGNRTHTPCGTRF